MPQIGGKKATQFLLAPNGSDIQSTNHFDKRGGSMANPTAPLQGIDFSAVSIDEDEKSRYNRSKMLTKFPPPPYLPGEIERREELQR